MRRALVFIVAAAGLMLAACTATTPPRTEPRIEQRSPSAGAPAPDATGDTSSPLPGATPDARPGSGRPALLGLPRRVAAVYWSSWDDPMPITALPESFNTIYLFNAERSSPTGTVVWRTAIPTPLELETVRSRGQRVILSVGGSGNGIDFGSRAVSRRLVGSVVAINAQFGGTLSRPVIDGVDFNTFEAENVPRVSEYLWMFAELKRIFGSSFLVTSPPAPWKRSDQRLVRSALARELMDYAAPQYYGGAGLNAPEYILESVRTWVEDVADGEAGRVVVGFGMADRPHFSGLEEITEAWEAVESSLPGIRGAYLWHHRTDAAQGWVYARTLNPRVAGQFDPRS